MFTLFLGVLLLTIAASFIQRVSGFGFGIFVMMFFPFFLPTYGESVMLSGLLAGTTALLVALRHRQDIRWDVMGWVALLNLAVSAVSVAYMASWSNELLKRCLGGFLILIGLYFLFGSGLSRLSFRSRTSQCLVGAVSGLMGGMFAMPGPAVVIFCIRSLPDKRQYMATMQALSVVFNVFYTFVRARAGFWSDLTLPLWGIGLLGVVAGSWVGARCFERISSASLKRMVYLLMLASGAVALVG